MNIHEEYFARAFIVPKKQDRYLSLLGTVKGRSKLAHGLNHCQDLDMKYATLIPLAQQHIEPIEKILKQKGAPDVCYVMSSSWKTDGKTMSLREALEDTVGQAVGTLISCLPGRLAYFEFEIPNERYILEKP